MLELIYGISNEKVEPNKLFLCEENLQIPFGAAGYDSPLSVLKKLKNLNSIIVMFMKNSNTTIFLYGGLCTLQFSLL